MSGKRWRVVLFLTVLLLTARVLMPEAAEESRSWLLRTVGREEGSYAAALDRLGGQIAESFQEKPDAAVPAAEPEPLRYRAEEAAVSGERAPETAETEEEEKPQTAEDPRAEEPAAVASFLESQLPYRDYALPENVDYGYLPLPFAYTLPVSGCSSSGFGFRLHPIQNVVKFHYGTDVAANSGDDVLAFADGVVAATGYDETGYGNYIILDHGDGWRSLSAHCSRVLATAGQSVRRGERIALVGATGGATGPHLHFELTKDGVYLNPEYYIDP